jgi:hypothetical protein
VTGVGLLNRIHGKRSYCINALIINRAFACGQSVTHNLFLLSRSSSFTTITIETMDEWNPVMVDLKKKGPVRSNQPD